MYPSINVKPNSLCDFFLFYEGLRLKKKCSILILKRFYFFLFDLCMECTMKTEIVFLFTSEIINGIDYKVKLSKAFVKNPFYLKNTDTRGRNCIFGRNTSPLALD